MDLFDTSTNEDIHINQKLIDYGFAVFQEESHASKVRKLNLSELSALAGNRVFLPSDIINCAMLPT